MIFSCVFSQNEKGKTFVKIDERISIDNCKILKTTNCNNFKNAYIIKGNFENMIKSNWYGNDVYRKRKYKLFLYVKKLLNDSTQNSLVRNNKFSLYSTDNLKLFYRISANKNNIKIIYKNYLYYFRINNCRKFNIYDLLHKLYITDNDKKFSLSILLDT